jgi:hypothetical protein
MDKKELLTKFFDSVVKNEVADKEAGDQAMKTFCLQTVKNILSNKQKPKQVSENYKKFMQLLKESEYDISFNGDQVIVNGKSVGRIINQLDDNSPIVFISTNGRVKQEFDTAEQLFQFIEQQFGQQV